MVGVFVRLKLRLLRRGVSRSGLVGIFLFVLMWLLSAAVGVGAGLGAGALIGASADPVLMTSLVFTLVFVLWLVIPLFTGSLDETLDPRRFALFPLPGATLATGLTAAALIGPGALTTALTLGGAVRALDADGVEVAVVVAAAAVSLVASVVWARVIATTFATVLSSRRGRELGGVLAAVLGLAVALGAQQMENMFSGFATGRARRCEPSSPGSRPVLSAGPQPPPQKVGPKRCCGWSTASCGSWSGFGHGGRVSPAS